MITYAEKHGYISPEDVQLLNKIKREVEILSLEGLGIVDEKGNEIEVSCHILARAVAKKFGLEYVDGYYTLGNTHSWVLTPDGNIIDVYPWATVGGPLLISKKFAPPLGYSLYIPISTRKISYGNFSKPWFRKAVRIISAKLKN